MRIVRRSDGPGRMKRFCCGITLAASHGQSCKSRYEAWRVQCAPPQSSGNSNSRRQIYVFFAVTFYAALSPPPIVNAPNTQTSQGGAGRCPTLLLPSRLLRENCTAT
jgi:hypothetical protein